MKEAERRHAAVGLEAITTFALELFNQNGYDGTGTEGIANSLSITKAALCYHAPGGNTSSSSSRLAKCRPHPHLLS